MATDVEQLTLDIGVCTRQQASSPPLRRRATEAACPTSETSGELATLVLRVDRTDALIHKCRLLMQLVAAVDEALAVSIADAYAEHRSWRKLSSMLEVPFQTLHRRYAPVIRDAPGAERLR